MDTNGLRHIILFVHGFGSSSGCWGRLRALLESDDRITSRYELRCWDYPTRWVELNLFGRIPRLQELGRALAAEIDSPAYRGRSVTLVGHSQGGLVILSYFADLLGRGEAARLRNIRQAIFFATPCEGSTTAMSVRMLASTLFHNPQELTLRVLNPDIADIRAAVRERVVAAIADSDHAWRVPIHAFCGMQDSIVPEASARGPFESVRSVPGNHFTILRPKDPRDPRYAEFTELLLDPGGHGHRFEIDRYEVVLRVEPRPPQSITTAGRNPRTFVYDNYATLRRTVRVAPSNRCRSPFTLRYGTRQTGYVVGHESHRNLVPPAEAGRWEDTGTFYQFDFVPEPLQDYCLDVEVYNGFNAGERDIHFHLGTHSHYRRLSCELDLSAYLANGYAVSAGPHFYLQPEDVPHGEMCRSRAARTALPVASDNRAGVFRWELTDLQQGVVDIVWDVAAVSAAAAPAFARGDVLAN